MFEWLFTPQCAACETPAATLCETCRSLLDALESACPRCAEPTADDAICRRCLATPLPLDRIMSPWRYAGPLAIAIKRLKFTKHGNHVARTVAPLWAELVAAAAEPGALVVPVPLHWRRRFTRGYDHAWLLAVHACREAGLPRPVPALRRIRGAPPQSKLSAVERTANLEGAFVADARVAGRAVVLVDDVVTTGATLAASARALLDAGATCVTGVCLARATSVPG
jgi:ComF family protein